MMEDAPGTRRNQYFVPGEGIAREVITADICKYLDNDATVRPGAYQGRQGYIIYAYRNLTTEMIHDLQQDSLKWEKEKDERRRRRGGPGPTRNNNSGNNANFRSPEYSGEMRYDQSITHQDRTRLGPSVPETPAPPTGYQPGRAPPPRADYIHQTPSPYQSEPSQPVQSPGGYPSASRAPGYREEYSQPPPHTQQPRMPTSNYDYPGNYAPDRSHEYPPSSGPGPQYSSGMLRGYPAGSQAPIPPQRYPNFASGSGISNIEDSNAGYDDYMDTRPDPRPEPSGNQRQYQDRPFYQDSRRAR